MQSITNIVLLDFSLVLFSWMFISFYATISNVYISLNAIFECLNMFFGWKRGHQLSTTTQLVGGWGGSSKMSTAAYTGGDFTSHVFMFLATFLSYIIMFYLLKFNLTLFKKDVFFKNCYFLHRDQFLSSWNKLFYLKLFLRSKVN